MPLHFAYYKHTIVCKDYILLKCIYIFVYYDMYMVNNSGKERITITVSPYVKKKLAKYVGKGKENAMFSSISDAANTALIEMLFRIEQEEKNENEVNK